MENKNTQMSYQDKIKQEKTILVKQWVISSIKSYLCEHNIEYTEQESLSTDSLYFHIKVDRNNWQKPVIRVSNHKGKGEYRLAEFNLCDFSYRTTKQKVKNRVYKKLDNGFKNSKTSGTLKAMEKLDKTIKEDEVNTL